MALNNPWWEDDPEQRYWLEITDRDDLGDDLLSPKTGTGGKPTPGYESMVHVKTGDIIFHYWQQSGQEPAIVSWSQAIGEAFTSTITWTPHSKNSYKQRPTTRAAWQVPLGGMTDLSQPVSLSALRAKESQLKKMLSSLEGSHGKPVYFPVAFYGAKPLRAAQAYLTKFPREFLDLFPVLREATSDGSGGATTKPDGTSPAPRQRTAGYIADAWLRKAIETQAMRQAQKYLEKQGYTVEDVSATRPYDFHATKGDLEVTVEVKGSTGSATTVELTSGEVGKAQGPGTAMLIVVDSIPWEKNSDSIETGDGEVRVWTEWEPEDERLLATRYRYLLPPATE